MTEILQTIALFAVMGALCWYLERLCPEDDRQPRWRRDSSTEVFYFSVRVILSTLVVAALAVTGYNLPDSGGRNVLAAQPFWIQATAVLFLSDLISYWVHRLMHYVPLLWRIHAIHHS